MSQRPENRIMPPCMYEEFLHWVTQFPQDDHDELKLHELCSVAPCLILAQGQCQRASCAGCDLAQDTAAWFQNNLLQSRVVRDLGQLPPTDRFASCSTDEAVAEKLDLPGCHRITFEVSCKTSNLPGQLLLQVI